uniref:Uncharacterized protein n=1 Tax=Cannabis sativa TaxID=3483 RepID=A0A803PPP8_CANSA
MSKEDIPERQDLLSMEDIAHMIMDLEELIEMELRGSKSNVSARGNFINLEALSDGEVEEVNQYFKFSIHGDDIAEEDEEVDVSNGENTPLDEPFC